MQSELVKLIGQKAGEYEKKEGKVSLMHAYLMAMERICKEGVGAAAEVVYYGEEIKDAFM